jgi:hypothetical protein
MRDPVFQALMSEAEQLFQQKNYDDALAVFKQARQARPYNVHPKVKIHDLEVLIKARNEAPSARASGNDPMIAAAIPTPPVEPLSLPQMERTATKPDVVTEAENRTPITERKPLPVQPRETPPNSERSGTSPGHVAASPAPAHPSLQRGERIYKEAGAVVIERTFEEDGRLVTYRKVIPPWGPPVHFKDGTPITIHGWEEVFGDR